MNIFNKSGEYKHFKGGEYILVCKVQSKTQKDLVLYLSKRNDSFWLREEDVFFEEVSREGKTFPRFQVQHLFSKERAKDCYQKSVLRLLEGEKIIFEQDMSEYILLQTDKSLKENQIPVVEKVASK